MRVGDGETEETRTATGGPPEREPDPASGRLFVAPATAIDRFSILSVVGAGGMGQVYAAYDPELDRRVALKLLHASGDTEHQQRLVREARALARVTHPNVVAVHEVGTHDGRPFIAMEFVEGQTLAAWSDAHAKRDKNRLRSALALLVAAGRGLKAAHEAGLVHRDVKPKNIIVGDDGRVRVVDFGLARGGDGHASEAAATEKESEVASATERGSSGTRALLDETLTQTGRAIGTPAYMAPEQFEGAKIDAQTDQFGFCVTAWEVLYGTRPFPTKTLGVLLEAILRGKVERPEAIALPAGVDKALRRGLAFDSKRRHETMGALVATLERELAALGGGPKTGRWRWALPLAAGGVLVAYNIGRTERVTCEGATELVSDVWNEDRRAALEEAIVAVDVPFAAGTWQRLEINVDRWRDQWVEGHRDACLAARVRGEQSTSIMDLRMACLDTRRKRMDAYLDILASPTAERLAAADAAFEELPPIERCTDLVYVQSRGSLPDDPRDAIRAEALETQIARAEASHAAGDYDEAERTSRRAVGLAGQLNMPGLTARAELALGRTLSTLWQVDEARTHLEAAYLAARKADATATAARAGRALIWLAGNRYYDIDEAWWWVRITEAEVEKLDDPEERILLALATARTHGAEGNMDAALSLARRAVADARQLAGSDPLVATAESTLGGALLRSGAADEALRRFTKSTREAIATFGARHPRTLKRRLQRARALLDLSDAQGALDEANVLLADLTELFGADHVELLSALGTQARALSALGRGEDALATLHRARSLSSPTGLDPVREANLREHECELLNGLGRRQEALLSCREAYRLFRGSLGPRHVSTARSRVTTGATLVDLGRIAEGQAQVDAGKQDLTDYLEYRDANAAVVHSNLARVAQIRGDRAAAVRHNRRAVEIIAETRGVHSQSYLQAAATLCGKLADFGRGSEAIAQCDQAAELLRSQESPDSQLRAMVSVNLGAAHFAAENFEAALKHYEEALELWERNVGRADMMASVLLGNIAEVRLSFGQTEASVELYAEALSIREAALGQEHPALVVLLTGSADAAIASGDPTAAIAFATRANDLANNAERGSRPHALAAEKLAQVLWNKPKRHAEALGLARDAASWFRLQGDGSKSDYGRVQAWIAERAPKR